MGDVDGGEGSLSSKWQWVILAEKDFNETCDRRPEVLKDVSDFIDSAYHTEHPGMQERVYLFDSSVVLSKYPFRISPRDHYTRLFMSYVRMYGGEKVKSDLSTFFTTLGIVSALILTVLSYEMPEYEPEKRSAQLNAPDATMQAYAILTGISAVLSIISIICCVLLMAKLAQVGEREVLMYIYSAGKFVGITTVCMILGTLAAFLSINLRLYIAFGPPAWNVVFGLTGGGFVLLISLFIYMNIQTNRVRYVLASVEHAASFTDKDLKGSEALSRSSTLARFNSQSSSLGQPRRTLAETSRTFAETSAGEAWSNVDIVHRS